VAIEVEDPVTVIDIPREDRNTRLCSDCQSRMYGSEQSYLPVTLELDAGCSMAK
jgi:hypothetical protein